MPRKHFTFEGAPVVSGGRVFQTLAVRIRKEESNYFVRVFGTSVMLHI